MQPLRFEVGGKARPATIESLIIAGWTGRDRAAVERHIAELAAIGVAPPRAVPCFYRVGANLATTAAVIEVVGQDSSGEVEVVLVALDDGLYVGVGSDHTDRKVEAYGVTVAKQMCPKPVGRELWPFHDVAGHWDELVLRSWVTRDARRELYQEGAVTMMLPPDDLMARYLGSPGTLPAGTAMFCGTLPVHGEIRGGERFEVELEDRRLQRVVTHGYAVRCLDVAD